MSVIGENRIMISRYEQLLWLSETNIRVGLQHKDLIIQGEHLVVKILTAEKLEVSGTLSMIQFEGR
ncbi:MAG: YabP/YqfC family sporulation protein [Bacillota bacterium]